MAQKQTAQAAVNPDSSGSDQMHHVPHVQKALASDAGPSVKDEVVRPSSQKHSLGNEYSSEGAPEPKRVAVGGAENGTTLAHAGSLGLSGMTEIMRVLEGEGASAETPGSYMLRD